MRTRPDLLRYITLSEAAAALDTKPWTIHERVEAGKLGAILYDGKLLVSAADVEELDVVVPQGRACFPATPEVLRALDLPLQAINGARGTDHTLAHIAASGLDAYHGDELTLADTDAMAVYIGGTLFAKVTAS